MLLTIVAIIAVLVIGIPLFLLWCFVVDWIAYHVKAEGGDALEVGFAVHLFNEPSKALNLWAKVNIAEGVMELFGWSARERALYKHFKAGDKDRARHVANRNPLYLPRLEDGKMSTVNAEDIFGKASN